jgi:AraC family transcriptional regulator of arabinose operon
VQRAEYKAILESRARKEKSVLYIIFSAIRKVISMQDEVLLCGYSYHTERCYRGGRELELTSYLIRLQTEGKCKAIIGGKLIQISAGDLILLPPGTTYELRIEEPLPAGSEVKSQIKSADYFLFCQGEWMDEWWKRTPRPRRIRIELNDSMLSIWNELILEKCRYNEDNREMISYLLRLLCLHLDRCISTTHPSTHPPYTASRMKRYIEEHAFEMFRVEDVANYAGLSVSRASHFFKECYGTSIIQYALGIRLASAVERMKYTSMSLDQISDSCGFKSYTFFHKAFKKKYGMSPADYRSRLLDVKPKTTK